MSVPEMGRMLGLCKTESYWLIKKNYFKTILVGNTMRVMIDSFEECWELKIEKLCFDKYCTCFGRTGYIQSFVPKNSMEFLIILVEKFGLK